MQSAVLKNSFNLNFAGGGAAAGFSCGTAAALDGMLSGGLGNNIHVAHGSSAGVGSMMCLISSPDQFSKNSLQLWTSALSDDRFMKFSNIVSEQPMVDIDYLVDDVFKKQFPLDVDNILSSSTQYSFFVYDHTEKRNVLVGNTEESEIHLTAENIHLFIKASMAMPFGYERDVLINERLYSDASAITTFDLRSIDTNKKTLLLINSNKTGSINHVLFYMAIACLQLFLMVFIKRYRKNLFSLGSLALKGYRERKTMRILRNYVAQGYVLIIEPQRKIGGTTDNALPVLEDNYYHGREVIGSRKNEIIDFLNS